MSELWVWMANGCDESGSSACAAVADVWSLWIVVVSSVVAWVRILVFVAVLVRSTSDDLAGDVPNLVVRSCSQYQRVSCDPLGYGRSQLTQF